MTADATAVPLVKAPSIRAPANASPASHTPEPRSRQPMSSGLVGIEYRQRCETDAATEAPVSRSNSPLRSCNQTL